MINLISVADIMDDDEEEGVEAPVGGVVVDGPSAQSSLQSEQTPLDSSVEPSQPVRRKKTPESSTAA